MSVWSRLASGAGWLLASGMSAVAAARLTRAEAHPYLILAQGVAVWLLLPAYPLAAVGLATRRRALASVAAALAVGHATWAAGAVSFGSSRTGPATVTQVTANLLAVNPDLPAAARTLAGSGADVVLLQEVTDEVLRSLRDHGLLDRFPHHVLYPRPGYHGAAILSRLPLAGSEVVELAGFPAGYADVVTAAGPVRIVNVHAPAPVRPERIALWRSQLAQLPGLRPPPGTPFVLAGDFNATLAHRPMADLVASGLRDAHREAATGLGATWPRVPLMRLDHILLSPELTPLTLHTRPTPGSDHRHLVARLAVTQS